MLEEALRMELQIHKLKPNASKRRLVQAYNASHVRLLECAREWNRLIAGLNLCSVELRPLDMPDGDAKAAEAAAKLTALLGEAPTAGPPCTTAAMVAQPSEKLCLALREDLEARVRRLAAEMVRHVHTGYQQALFGPITWLDDETVEFKYFMAPVLYVDTEQQATRKATYTSVRTTHHYQHRSGYHQQHLMEAKVAPGLPPRDMLPPRLRPLSDLLPAYLHGIVSTVEGLLIAERVVEWDVETSQSTHDAIIPHPRIPFDPAIIIGPYVLAGWTDRDFHAADSLTTTARRWVRRTRITAAHYLSSRRA
jgi:hypothetical protein